MALQESNSKGYILESVLLNSNRFKKPVQLVESVTDIEIFEHLDKPWITAQLMFVDAMRLFDRLDINGHESLTITVKNSNEDDPIVKEFIVNKIIRSIKGNEQNEVTAFHLVEKHAYKSNLINVNRAYSGYPDRMIGSILDGYLNKDLLVRCSSINQSKIKMIIPNKTPLDAAIMIKNRTTTNEGLPVYMFSSFNNDYITLADLGRIIDQPPVNTKSPFFYGLTENHTEVTGYRHIKIYDYKIANTDELSSLIGKGLVNAKYSFYDSLSGDFKNYNYDIVKNAVEHIPDLPNQSKNFPDNLEIDDIKIQNYSSKQMSAIHSSGAYDDATGRFKSFQEEFDPTNHEKKITARSLKHLLMKTPLDIRVPGSGFLHNDADTTIGNKIRVLFLGNAELNKTFVPLDLKKSGDYIIYAAKHTMSTTRYDITFSCVKLNSFNDDTSFKSFGI